MFTNFTKIIFFILAYIPLIGFISIEFIPLKKKPILILIIGISVILILVTYILNKAENIKGNLETISVIENKNSEYMAFLITYLVPFFGFTLNLRSIIALLTFFIFLGYFYIKSPIFCINPLLNLFWGYNIYEITIGDERALLLTKCNFISGNLELELADLKNGVYLGQKDGQNK